MQESRSSCDALEGVMIRCREGLTEATGQNSTKGKQSGMIGPRDHYIPSNL